MPPPVSVITVTEDKPDETFTLSIPASPTSETDSEANSFAGTPHGSPPASIISLPDPAANSIPATTAPQLSIESGPPPTTEPIQPTLMPDDADDTTFANMSLLALTLQSLEPVLHAAKDGWDTAKAWGSAARLLGELEGSRYDVWRFCQGLATYHQNQRKLDKLTSLESKLIVLLYQKVHMSMTRKFADFKALGDLNRLVANLLAARGIEIAEVDV